MAEGRIEHLARREMHRARRGVTGVGAMFLGRRYVSGVKDMSLVGRHVSRVGGLSLRWVGGMLLEHIVQQLKPAS